MSDPDGADKARGQRPISGVRTDGQIAVQLLEYRYNLDHERTELICVSCRAEKEGETHDASYLSLMEASFILASIFQRLTGRRQEKLQ